MLPAKKKIVVLVSGNGSNLQTIIDQCEAGKIAGHVVAVITNKANVYSIDRANQHNIPCHVIEHAAYATRMLFETALGECIDNRSPDLLVLAGFMRILSAEFVERYQGKMLNIHPSLLPKHRGLNTHQRAIDEGDTEHGASVHFVSAELDGGAVVLQANVPIFENDSADELAQRVVVQEHMIYPLVINWFCLGRLALNNGQAVLDGKILGLYGYAQD